MSACIRDRIQRCLLNFVIISPLWYLTSISAIVWASAKLPSCLVVGRCDKLKCQSSFTDSACPYKALYCLGSGFRGQALLSRYLRVLETLTTRICFHLKTQLFISVFKKNSRPHGIAFVLFSPVHTYPFSFESAVFRPFPPLLSV